MFACFLQQSTLYNHQSKYNKYNVMLVYAVLLNDHDLISLIEMYRTLTLPVGTHLGEEHPYPLGPSLENLKVGFNQGVT